MTTTTASSVTLLVLTFAMLGIGCAATGDENPPSDVEVPAVEITGSTPQRTNMTIASCQYGRCWSQCELVGWNSGVCRACYDGVYAECRTIAGGAGTVQLEGTQY